MSFIKNTKCRKYICYTENSKKGRKKVQKIRIKIKKIVKKLNSYGQ